MAELIPLGDANIDCCVSAVRPEPGPDGAESDPAGAAERPRAEELPAGLLCPAAGRSSPHPEAACGDGVLPQRPALPLQHSDPASSGKRPQPLAASWSRM